MRLGTPNIFRIESVNGSPVVEFRVHVDGHAVRRALLPSGKPYRDGASAWERIPGAELRAMRAAQSPAWLWLQAQGVRAPSASGTSLSDAERAANGRARLTLRPRAGALDTLDALAERWECSRTEAFERAILEAWERG